MNLPRYITDMVEVDSDVTVDKDNPGFIQLNGDIRFKRDFGPFTKGRVVANLTFDFDHGEVILYDQDCEREVVVPFLLQHS
jgi:hypothetical protein